MDTAKGVTTEYSFRFDPRPLKVLSVSSVPVLIGLHMVTFGGNSRRAHVRGMG